MTSLLLLTLEETLPDAPERTWERTAEDAAPPTRRAQVAAKPEVKPAPRTATPEATARTSQKPELSDARVAELERAIGSSTPASDTLVGKKGKSAAVMEETASGHQEGDAPVRVSKEPLLPAGESGRIVPTTPKVNPTSEPSSEGLPSEVEARAKAMGQSAGKLSVGAAQEVEAPDKPVGQGRKGSRSPEETEAEPKAPTNSRPRRVKDEEKADADAPLKDKKKPNNPYNQ